MSGTTAGTLSIQPPRRGATPSPRSALAAAVPHAITVGAPPNFITVPQEISFWGNDVHGDCVTAEEAFAKACNSPEIFISDDEVIAWATRHNVLEGAYLTQVMQWMQNDGFVQNERIYNDGPYFSVNWTDAAILQSAISNGPVKIGVAANQLEAAWRSTNGRTGWFGTGFQPDGAEDHSVSLCGYGTLGWLAQQLHVQVPAGIDGTKPGYALFTWNSIGIIDQPSMVAITHEAWLRQPTTIIKSTQNESSKTSPSLTSFHDRIWAAFIANNNTNQVLVCSSADGQTWTGNTLVHGETSKTAPSLAVFNNKIWVAFIANNNTNQVLVCSSADGQTWTGNTLVHGESSKTTPSLAVFNNRIWVAFIANNDTNQVLVCSSADGQTWTGNTQVHGESSKTAPSLAVFNNRMWVAFVANNSSNQVLVCSSADGQNWTGNTLVHGELSKTAPSLAVFNNRIWVAFIANNNTNQVLVCSSADGQTWTGNTLVHGESSKTAPSLAVFKNELWVSFIANNSSNNVLLCSSADGHTWTGNIVI